MEQTAGMTDIDEERVAARRKRIVIAIIVAAILLLGILGFFLTRGDDEAAAGDAAAAADAQAPVVTVVAPGSKTVVRSINATGTIGARFDTPISVVGEGGRVTQVYVDAGDWVKQGQVLASVDRSVQNQQAEGLRAQISVAESSLNLAQAQLNRALQLVDRGFISQADVDRLTAEKERAQAQLRVARGRRTSYGLLHSQQAHQTRCRLAVPNARLCRAKCERRRACVYAVHRHERPCLRRIAQRRACAVCLQAAHERRRHRTESSE